jgi:hypothetical protein
LKYTNKDISEMFEEITNNELVSGHAYCTISSALDFDVISWSSNTMLTEDGWMNAPCEDRDPPWEDGC